MRKQVAILALLLSVILTAQGQTDTVAFTEGSVSRLSASAVVPASTEHSARKAMLLSIVPGAGQIYNRQAWKLPIIYGAFAGLGYLIYNNYTNMVMFREEYLTRVNGGTPQLEGYLAYPNSNIYNMYQSYNKNFQLSIIVSLALYGLNLVDAYVFGHLFDFQIDDDLSLNFSPSLVPDAASPVGFSPSAGLTLTF